MGSTTGVVVVGSATGVVVVGSATGLLVVSPAALLELLVGAASDDEVCRASLVDVSATEVSVDEASPAELLLLDVASVDETLVLSLDEELSDGLWAAELLSDELSLEEVLSEELSEDDDESGVGVGTGGVT